MCDPLTIGLAVAGAAMNAMQQQAIAKQQQQAATQQALSAYEAAEQQLEAEYAEANRQIAEVQEQEVEEASDIIRQANEELGTLRVAETALSDASLGNLYFESYYTNSVDLQRLDENTDKQIDAAEASKGAAQQGYLNTVRQAKNRASNVMMETAARSSGAMLNIVGSAAGAAASDYKQGKMIAAIKKS